MFQAERIREIIKSNKLTQRKFAESLKITESYVSMLLKDSDINISLQLLELIEKTYGYNAKWITTGIEPKFSKYDKDTGIPETNRRLMSMVENLPPEQSKAVLAFINFLDETEENIKKEISETDDELSADKEAEIEAEGEAYKDELRLEANMKTSQVSPKCARKSIS